MYEINDNELKDALRQIDTFTEAYVRIRNDIDKIQSNQTGEILLAALQRDISIMENINTYFVQMASTMDEELRDNEKNHHLYIELSYVRAVCDFTSKCTKGVRTDLSEAIEAFVLGK